MSSVMRKPTFCICENKDADQLHSNHEADQRHCFRYRDSTIPLLSKSKISSLQPSSVAVQPGLWTRSETRMLVFSWCGTLLWCKSVLMMQLGNNNLFWVPEWQNPTNLSLQTEIGLTLLWKLLKSYCILNIFNILKHFRNAPFYILLFPPHG